MAGLAGRGLIGMRPIAYVHAPRKSLEDDYWGDVVSKIELDTAVVPAQALDGIEAFSHLEVVFCFHRVRDTVPDLAPRHPRGLTHLPKIGILAQRAKDRPNHIGVSRCELLSRDTSTLVVRGLDAIDETPVLDIKPWTQAFAPRQAVTEPDWVSEVMKTYYSPGHHRRED